MSERTSSPSPALSLPPAQRPSLTPQRLQAKGPNDTLVLNSPYGPTRNAAYGWGSLFQPPISAVLTDHPHIHIGISSLNGVPTIGKSDRSMRSLLTQYRKKFNCLEHCYPYHKVGDAATWQSWADMVKDSNVVRPEIHTALSASSLPLSLSAPCQTAEDRAAATVSSSTDSPASSRRMLTVNGARFVYTVKANNLLTHVKQLQMRDGEVQEHVATFFHQRCPLLEPFLGPILVQLPPSFGYAKTNIERLSELYEQLTREEVVLQEVADTTATETRSPSQGILTCQWRQQRRIRIAVEFRNRNWYRQETFDLLRSFRWALVVAHHHDDPTFSSVVDTGAGFLYLRLHGPLGRSVGDYGSLAMKLWAEEIVHYLHPPNVSAERRGTRTEGEGEGEAAQQKEVFVFLNNSDSNVGGTTSSTVDATCLAKHLRQLLRSVNPSVGPVGNATSTGGTTTQPPNATPSTAGPVVVESTTTATTTSVTPGDDRDADGEGQASPPAKRPRTSTQSGGSRDDEVVID